MLVVGGAGTHYGGGPSHNAIDSNTSPSSTRKAIKTDSFIDDVAEDLGLPPVADRLATALSNLFRK